MNIFELSLPQILEKLNDPDFLKTLPTLSYDELYFMDIISHYKVSQYLNQNGYCSLTVCPECHIDDFIHVEGCSKII